MTFLGEFVMERRSGTDAPRAVPALPGPVSAALVLGFAFVLGAGEAAAQRVCSNTPTGGQTIDCTRGDANDIDIDAHDVAISTTAQTGFGVYARHTGSGDVNVALTGGSVTTTGTQAYGVIGWHVGASGAVDVDIKNTIVKTSGFNAFGVIGVHQGAGTVAVNVDIEGGTVETTGYPSHAVHALQAGPGDVALGLKDATVRTTNARTAHGVFAQHRGATGNLRLDVQGGSVETFGLHSFGVFGRAVDTPGGVEVSVADASVTTRGRLARAIAGRHRGAGAVTVDVSGDTAVTAEGEGGIGVEAFSGGGGAVEIAVGANVAIEAPFANGIVGRQTVAPGRQITAPGRIVVTHRGNVRARNVGVFAWDDPMIGSTFGDGESAAETAGDEPAIHVTSSGDVTVGENVMDAYIRAAVAGEDETLQAGEQAVLDAITAGNSDALDTALDALPDDYDDVWQTRARGFLAARPLSPTDRFSWTAGVEPTDPGARRADEAAVEILGLSHAGIRAMALSHLAVVDHIREGDVDPDIVASVATITAIAENTRTPQQRETLAMQQETLATQRMLSPAERAVLAAALTGGDLDAALAALPAAYTDTWKDEVRRRAAGYNADDIRVDVTGGTIASDGDGVDARYVLAHDRNGAIAVTVADGARITGERHGLYLGGAGLADGNDDLRDQTATVNGAVMGGTGAGVYLAGGGTVTVGRTGRVGATSGMAVLSNGPGDLSVTVEREGEITGDVRAQGGGVLTVDVMEGGVVTGTVHDPAGPLTVRGSIGRLLYTNGGTVTVAATGRLTGVEAEGRTEAIRSEAGDLGVTVAAMGRVSGGVRGMGDGDLNATVSGTVDGDVVKEGAGDLTAMVSGRVEGDVLNRGGGDLIFSSLAGSTVTGSVHDPRPMSVHGSVGRLLYSNGGNVRVAGTGRITGIEGTAIRAEAGDLVVRIDRGGEINGDVLALAGRLTLDLPADSVIERTLHNPVNIEDPTAPFEVRGSIGRIVYDDGGTLTVTETGRLTGVEGVALLSRAGALTLDVSGTVKGDVVARGTGKHTVTVLEEGDVVEGTVRFVGGDNLVEVHEGAHIRPKDRPDGLRGLAIVNERGAPEVAVRATGGEAASNALPRNEEDHTLKVVVVAAEKEPAFDALSRIEGWLYDHRGVPDVWLQRGAGGELPVGRLGSRMAYADGAHDVGWVPVPEREDEFKFQEDLAPRSRLYEALPSVLLGLNAPVRYEERMAAARAEQGGWARVETVHGKWKADASTSQKLSRSGVELEYDHRRHGLQAGMDVAAGEDGLFGVSLHHRRGSADVSNGGKVELSGHGVGVSGAWGKGGVYVDVQAEATLYEADFTSSLRGALKQDVSGHGYALGVEAGRRFALDGAPAGMVLTPRAGLVHSRVSVGDFTDAVGTRVSLEDGGSLKGRAGMVVEVKPQWWARGSRVFGSVDVEREFSKDRKVRVSGTELRSEADATWLRFGLNGSHVLDGGRWTVAGRVGYATSGGSHELGGGLHLKMRF